MLYAKNVACALLAALVLLPLWGGEGAAATLALSGTTAVVQDNGTEKKLPPEAAQVRQSRYSPFSFVALGEDQAKQFGVPMGVYLFHKDGTPAGIVKTPEAAYCTEVFLSPDKKYLLVDAGTFVLRTVSLYSYPQLTLLRPEGIQYYDHKAVTWIDNTRFVYNTKQTANTQRVCGYDPCGPGSVSIFDMTSQQEKFVKQGNDLCDYVIERVANGKVDIAEYCLASPQMWKERGYDSIPAKHLTVTP